MKFMYDPPSGWKYGFPKVVDSDTDIRQLLLDSGYPEDQIEFAIKYSRHWSAEEDTDDTN